jgi:hypothetical protein
MPQASPRPLAHADGHALHANSRANMAIYVLRLLCAAFVQHLAPSHWSRLGGFGASTPRAICTFSPLVGHHPAVALRRHATRRRCASHAVAIGANRAEILCIGRALRRSRNQLVHPTQADRGRLPSTSMLDRNRKAGLSRTTQQRRNIPKLLSTRNWRCLCAFLVLGHKGKPHGGEIGEGRDGRVVQRAGSHMRRCAFASDEVKESSHVTSAYPVRFTLHAVVCF